MATTNILPFGQSAEMPAGYPIADDLKTNSAQQALSARQGKEIGDYLFGKTETAVDISELTKKTGLLIGIDNTQWSNTFQNNQNYECVLMPCQSGETYSLTAKANTSFHYAVLTNNSLVVNQTPSYASGYSERIVVTAGNSETIEIPTGGKYLYILVTNNNVDSTPTMVKIEDSAGLNNKIGKIAGDEAMMSMGKFAILIAAADAPEWQKAKADYVCTGVDDQDVIQSVINGFGTYGGRIILSTGNFNIGHFRNTRFSSNDCAILIPQTNTVFSIEGVAFNLSYNMSGDNDYIGRKHGGTCIHVSPTCYESLSSSKSYYVFGAPQPASGGAPASVVSLNMKNIRITLPLNQKPITCIDCKYIGSVYLQFIWCSGYTNGYNGQYFDNTHPNPIAVEGCVGIRGVGGSNFGMCYDFKNVIVNSFRIGFDLSGEHFIGVNLGASKNFIGYRFAGYTSGGGAVGHPMTLINCSDEQSNCGPVFGEYHIKQQIDLLCWNEERGGSSYPYDPNDETESVTKQGHRWQNATEECYRKDGNGNYLDINGNITTDPTEYVRVHNVCGRIEYSIYTQSGEHSLTELFWEPGHGLGTISKNMMHKLEYPITTLKGNGIKCDYMERFIAKDLNNKEVICIDPQNKTFIDTMGNQV